MTVTDSLKLCFVAAPLTARTGVYRSARELVTEARRQGFDWSLVLGVSRRASGAAPADDPSWIAERAIEPAGLGGVGALAKQLRGMPQVSRADRIVSLLPQTDMALSLTPLPWVAYLRGLPWPEQGESSRARRVAWRFLERMALKRADAVWATTPLLRDHVALRRPISIVAAGLEPVARQWDGRGERDLIVWAARFDKDKNPHLFLRAMAELPLRGVMYGSGPMEEELKAAAPSNVTVAGWVDPKLLWDGALAYAGTSHREAFGRSAVEAAMAGVPVVLSDSFGAAPLLVTDPELRDRLILPGANAGAWRSTFTSLAENESLRRCVSDHVAANGKELTVGRSVELIDAAMRAVIHDQ